MALTDPPYSSGGFTRGDRAATPTTKYSSAAQTPSRAERVPSFTGDNRDQRGQLAWMTLWLAELRRVLVEGGHVLVCTDWRQLPLTSDAIQAAGFVWRGILTWHKPLHRPLRGGVSPACEFLVHGVNGPTRPERPQIRGFFSQSAPGSKVRQHLTEKPVDLGSHVLGLARPGEVVVDPFVGSGAFGEAALRAGCYFRGCEISSHYHELSTARLVRVRDELERDD